MKLQETLMTKAAEGKLGHFYIVETSAPALKAFPLLMKFAHEFIRDYYQKIEKHKQSLGNLMDHPDVFVLGNTEATEEEKSEKAFKVEDAQALARFFEFRAVQAKRKFAVITQGHRITTTVANKWLKLFEEPQGTSTIFLLNPQRGQLLPTIHSRAIHLRIQAPLAESSLTEWNKFLLDLEKMNLSEFLDHYSRGEQDISYWIHHLLQWEAQQVESASAKEALETWLRSHQERETFNQPTATKWTLFVSHLRQHVLPRLSR
jgi:hypothetical protein